MQIVSWILRLICFLVSAIKIANGPFDRMEGTFRRDQRERGIYSLRVGPHNLSLKEQLSG